MKELSSNNEIKVYTGIAQVDNELNNVQTQGRRIVNNCINKMVKIAEQDSKKILLDLRLTASSMLKSIAFYEFQKAFTRQYGANYDGSSLRLSISTSLDDKYFPIIKFNHNNFSFSNTRKRRRADRKRFNQNLSEDNFQNLLNADEFIALDELSAYGYESENLLRDNLYEDIMEDLYNEDEEVFAKKKQTCEIDETIKIAKAQVLESYYEWYDNVLIPSFEKKYKTTFDKYRIRLR